MASQSRGTQFKLVQVDGYTERELFTADDLNQLHEYLSQKGGVENEP